MWNHYELEIKVDRLIAGIPANPRLLQAWLEVNGAPPEAVAEQTAMIERLDPELTHAVVFFRDLEGRPCYESRNMKAAFKEGANIIKGVLNLQAFRSKLAERVFVHPKLVPITVEIQRDERPLSVMTMQGPRTSIKRFEYAEDVELGFQLKVLDDGVVKESHLLAILEYLQEGGIGADRSQGAGTLQVVRFERLKTFDAGQPSATIRADDG